METVELGGFSWSGSVWLVLLPRMPRDGVPRLDALSRARAAAICFRGTVLVDQWIRKRLHQLHRLVMASNAMHSCCLFVFFLLILVCFFCLDVRTCGT